jgi:hypothetical protein
MFPSTISLLIEVGALLALVFLVTITRRGKVIAALAAFFMLLDVILILGNPAFSDLLLQVAYHH